MQRLTAAAAAAAAALAALYVLRRRRQRPAATTKPREPPSWPKVPLKLSENANELFSVCRLRYQVYVGELKRQNYSYVDDIEQVIEDPCDAEEGVQNWFVAHPEPSEWEAFVRKAAAPPPCARTPPIPTAPGVRQTSFARLPRRRTGPRSPARCRRRNCSFGA